MSTVDEAAQIIAGAVGDTMLTDVAAKALADAGLLMPDLPEPDLDNSDSEHRAEYTALWEGPVPNVWDGGLPCDLTVQTFPDRPEVQMCEGGWSMGSFSPEQARSLAFALLAAAQWAEQEQL